LAVVGCGVKDDRMRFLKKTAFAAAALAAIALAFGLLFAKESSRVEKARKEKAAVIQKMFDNAGVKYPPNALLIRVFKDESDMEAWAQPEPDAEYKLIKTYKICAKSGTLGPKRREGDGQVPEGFYDIDQFNPASSYYLSMRVNYPNESDKILGVKGKLGGLIYVHGDCATIGCMPIEDEIKELYVVALDVYAKTKLVQAHIFPMRMTAENWPKLEKFAEKSGNSTLLPFWTNLKEGYDYFEKHKKPAKVSADKTGKYIFK